MRSLSLLLSIALLLVPVAAAGSDLCRRSWVLFSVDERSGAAGGGAVSPVRASDVAAVADAMHALWQTSTTHRERFKPAKDADGQLVPISEANEAIEIRNYLRARGIPEEQLDSYRRYYRRTANGTLEEDIKHVPNRHLSPNNRAENDAGARAALDVVVNGDLSDVQTLEQGKLWLAVAAQRIHVRWLERNTWARGDAAYDKPWSELSPDMQQADLDPLKLAIGQVVTEPRQRELLGQAIAAVEAEINARR